MFAVLKIKEKVHPHSVAFVFTLALFGRLAFRFLEVE